MVRSVRASERGQSLVEFTLVLPFLLLLLFGIVDFGRAFYTWNTVTNAAREGARTASVQSNYATVNTAVRSTMGGLADSNFSWTPGSPSSLQGAKGSTVSVTVNYNFQYVTPISPLLNLVGADSLANPTLSSTSKMRLE